MNLTDSIRKPELFRTPCFLAVVLVVYVLSVEALPAIRNLRRYCLGLVTFYVTQGRRGKETIPTSTNTEAIPVSHNAERHVRLQRPTMFGYDELEALGTSKKVSGELAEKLHAITTTPFLSNEAYSPLTPDGRSKAAWRNLGVHRAGLNGWGLALLLPILVLGLAYGAVWLSGVARLAVPKAFGGVPSLVLDLVVSIAAVSFTGGLAEEIGWPGWPIGWQIAYRACHCHGGLRRSARRCRNNHLLLILSDAASPRL